ncbi:uncharacterized protein LOC110455208 [Mizuhopecten yessoensis]|uniref:uncharacterized protein LOC110455208 n=1 Tax=Mizuhopecten yessoensis TaxID=6573 RepID=UPI000B45D1C3|nr:uncharacterized protein LOC110455208 [Mizuhopecten yessoensis]
MSNNTINGSCVDQNNSTMNGTTHQNGTNNVDLWPKGPFTLLQPSSGCPDGWSTGYIQFEMQNPGSSYYSGTYLEGDSVNNLVQWHFCTKTSTDGSPNWPTGSYCILRHGGACPNAFMPGLVAFDEEDNGNQTNRVHHGTLPDLSSWFIDVALYFCCKNDGYNGSTEVTLPVTDPFYLFPYYNRDCQDVADMNKVREFTYFDCEDFSNQNNAAGATPLNVLNSNHNISFCYHYQ